mgnify:CR=1 FL=1
MPPDGTKATGSLMAGMDYRDGWNYVVSFPAPEPTSVVPAAATPLAAQLTAAAASAATAAVQAAVSARAALTDPVPTQEAASALYAVRHARLLELECELEKLNPS